MSDDTFERGGRFDTTQEPFHEEIHLGQGFRVDGRYVLESKIGKGGFGEVWAAADTRFEDRKVAVKFLEKADRPDEEAERRRRFDQEAEVLAKIQSRNVVRILDRGEISDGRMFFVMELLQGLPLDEMLRIGRRLMLGETLQIVREVAEVLVEAHAKGLIHRDLKPANIYMEELDGGGRQVRVLDFGIAKRQHDGDASHKPMTATGMYIGTAAYMAPEQFRGQSGPGSDLYALGAVAYQCLTGFIPSEIQPAGGYPPMDPAFGIPPEVETLISRMLKVQVELRLSSAAELKEEIERLIAGPPTTIPDGPPVSPSGPPPSPKGSSASSEGRPPSSIGPGLPYTKIVSVGAAVAVVGLAGFGAWRFWPPSPAPTVLNPDGGGGATIVTVPVADGGSSDVAPCTEAPEGFQPLTSLRQVQCEAIYTALRGDNRQSALPLVMEHVEAQPSYPLHLTRVLLESEGARCVPILDAVRDLQNFCKSRACPQDPRVERIESDCVRDVKVAVVPKAGLAQLSLSSPTVQGRWIEDGEQALRTTGTTRLPVGTYELRASTEACGEQKAKLVVQRGKDPSPVSLKLSCPSEVLTRAPRYQSSVRGYADDDAAKINVAVRSIARTTCAKSIRRPPPAKLMLHLYGQPKVEVRPAAANDNPFTRCLAEALTRRAYSSLGRSSRGLLTLELRGR